MGNTIPIACNLDALSLEERARRTELAPKMIPLATRVVEREDGYTVRLDFDPVPQRPKSA